jgi:EAL domain-containing protein (putative c-di-GMP-specific phosphodiesterase class I)
VARDIHADVAHALAASGLPACRLEVEITESVLLGDSPTTLAKLHALRELGVRIALDDFGTGYASLAYLRRFPFDQLKIDQAFVREISVRPDARAIVRATIDMARALRMDTIAEGVEEECTMRLLREQKCDSVQGFLVSRPVEAGAVMDFIADWGVRPAPALLSTSV